MNKRKRNWFFELPSPSAESEIGAFFRCLEGTGELRVDREETLADAASVAVVERRDETRRIGLALVGSDLRELREEEVLLHPDRWHDTVATSVRLTLLGVVAERLGVPERNALRLIGVWRVVEIWLQWSIPSLHFRFV